MKDKKIKVKFLVAVSAKGKHYQPDDTDTINERDASMLLRRGKAVEVTTSKTESKKGTE